MLLSNHAVCGQRKSGFMTKKNRVIFQMISLKGKKSLTIILLTADTFIPEIHFPDLLVVFLEQLLNIAKELKNLEKQVIQNIFVEINYTKLFCS